VTTHLRVLRAWALCESLSAPPGLTAPLALVQQQRSMAQYGFPLGHAL